MGQIQSIDVEPVCVPIPDSACDGHSTIYRNKHVFVENGGHYIETFRNQPDARTLPEILKGSGVKYRDCPCVGEREKLPEEKAGKYVFLTYKQFYDRAIAFGKGLLEMGLVKGDKVGIYSNNCINWQTIAFGCASVGIIFVPVYDSLGPTAAEYILDHSEAKVLFTSKYKQENAKLLFSKSTMLTHLVAMFDEPIEIETSKKVMQFKEIVELGEHSDIEDHFPEPEDTAVIMYTSGSTGTPKGCVLTQKNIVAGGAGFSCLGLGVMPGESYLSFLPLAHIYALVVELICFAHGVAIGYARGPISQLIEDITVMRPTMLTAVPRVLNKIFEVMQKKLNERPAIIQKIVRAAIHSKAVNAMHNHSYSLLCELLLKDFRAALGGRVRLIVNGGAPVMPEVFEFLCAAITPNIIQGYGLTETTAGVAVQQIPASNGLTVGPCGLACEVCMRPVPDTDYNAEGDLPCGELLVRGPILFKEYYKQPDLTRDAILPGDWFATGDVVKLTPEGELHIIDRAKNLVKLCQGEYLSITTLSELYGQAKGVACIFIYANSMYQYPCAVVFPDHETIARWEAAGITDPSTSSVCKTEMMDSLLEIHKMRELRGFERIQKIIIDCTEPTVENGLLTPSMKPQFASMKKKYEERLMQLYLE